MKKLYIICMCVLLLIVSFLIGKYYLKTYNIERLALVEDDCTEFANLYELALTQDIQANAELVKKETEYIVRIVDDKVVIYVCENGEESLKEITNISIEYLTDIDIQKLDKGIKVVGEKELSAVLEDFE